MLIKLLRQCKHVCACFVQVMQRCFNQSDYLMTKKAILAKPLKCLMLLPQQKART